MSVDPAFVATTTITSTTPFDGNIGSCADVPGAEADWLQIALGTGGGAPAVPGIGETVTVTGPGGVQIEIERIDDKTFTWTLVDNGDFTEGVDVVVNKAGPGGLIIDYRPNEGTGGTITHTSAPSHILFCYDLDPLPPLARISITPDGANEVNDAHTLTATIELDVDRDDTFGGTGDEVPAGTVITFSLASGPGSFFQTGTSTPATTCATVGTTGACTIDLNSATAGISVVNASANFSIDGTNLTPSTADAANVTLGGSGPATKVWVDATITIGPDGENAVNDPHTFTVAVSVNNPSPTSGDPGVQAAVGVIPSVIITSNPAGAVNSATVNSAAISATGNNLAATDASGESEAVIVSSVAGVFTANAFITLTIPVDVNGTTVNVVVNRDTDPATTTTAGPGGSGPAVKTYVGGTLIWEKRASSVTGALLGGASFQACRTHDETGADIVDECVNGFDNAAAFDADATNGEFSLQTPGAVPLGTWVITELTPPPGFTKDPTPQTVVLTIANPSNADATTGDVVPVFVNLPEQTFEGCTPGAWKNRLVPRWDGATDAIAIAAGFTTTTKFNTFFNLTAQQSGIRDNVTMLGALGLGGGNPNKLARHAVAALLNVAAGQDYNFPAGITSAAELYTAIRNALLNDTYEPLATQLDTANNAGCTVP